MFEYGYIIVDTAMIILWTIVGILIWSRKDHKVYPIEYFLCWACLMLTIVTRLAERF